MSTAAKRYAEALLEAIWQDEESQRQSTAEELSRLAQGINDVPDLKNALENPSYAMEERLRTLDSVSENLQLSPRVRNFARLIVERGRATEFGVINQTFKRLLDDRSGRQQATVYSAQALEEPSIEQIREALEKKVGCTLELDVQVDPALIGGIKAQVGSLVFDGSIKAELERLREKLTHV